MTIFRRKLYCVGVEPPPKVIYIIFIYLHTIKFGSKFGLENAMTKTEKTKKKNKKKYKNSNRREYLLIYVLKILSNQFLT